MPVAIVIEDNATSADLIARQLEAVGFTRPQIADTAAVGFQLVQQTNPDLVVVDERLPDASGTDLIRTVRQQFPNSTLVMCTVVDDESVMQMAFNAGCNYYTVKPNGLRNLCAQRKDPKVLLNIDVQEVYR